MSKERYPGERRGLSIFLEELHPVVVERLGPDHLLHHAIRRAVRSADLDHLRHARTLFNHLPREQRRELSGAMVARSGSSAPPKHEMIERYGRRPPASFVTGVIANPATIPTKPAMARSAEIAGVASAQLPYSSS